MSTQPEGDIATYATVVHDWDLSPYQTRKKTVDDDDGWVAFSSSDRASKYSGKI